MRKIIAWPLAWLLFWCGDIVSRFMRLHDQFGRLYPLYNWLMTKSCDVQDWGGIKTPWSKPVEEVANDS